MFQLLRRVLVAEINALQGMAAIGQRPLLMEVDASQLVEKRDTKNVFPGTDSFMVSVGIRK